MLKCATSLWSADLANLEADIQRVAPYSERFHLDVADGHYAPTMLFFPDLVAALRPHTDRPFEMHLMTTDPAAWIDPFAEAGADAIIICFDSATDPRAVLEAIKERGLQAGVSLLLEEDLDLLDPYWELLDVLTLLNTPAGIKGADMDPQAPARIRRARNEIDRRGLATVVADRASQCRLYRPRLADVQRGSKRDARVVGRAWIGWLVRLPFLTAACSRLVPWYSGGCRRRVARARDIR